MKRALVAGGGGFIGSHLCDRLLALGREVVIVDSFITGRRQNIEEALQKGARLIEADINDAAALSARLGTLLGARPDALLGFDEIYNLASPASPVDFAKFPVFIMETAAFGHRSLLELARQSGGRVLFASTSEVYGDPLVHPQKESYFGNVNPIGPRGCYDEAKRFGEALSYSYSRQHGVDICVSRIFNTYGSRMRPDDGRIIPNFFMQALQGEALTVYGDGSQTRSFCYVSDLVEGLIKLMESPLTTPTNIGNPVELTVIEIAERINHLVANRTSLRHLPLPENDPRQRRPDITQAKEKLGWQPRVSLEEGLDLCHHYFRSELDRAGGKIATRNV